MNNRPSVSRETKDFLAALSRLPQVPLDAVAMRAHRRRIASLFDSGPESVATSTSHIGVLSVRTYTPPKQIPGRVVIYIHGGGWVAGDATTHDGICRHLSFASKCAVLSVEYRRPPEHRHPIAVEDVFTVVSALLTNPGVSSLSLAGDSSGAHIVVEAMQLLDGPEAATISSLLLIQPACDPSMSERSWVDFGTGYFLSASAMEWFWAEYLGGANAEPLWGLPLTNMPPTMILTASLDPTRDESLRFAEALRSAGVPVDLLNLDGLPHGCFTLPAAFPSATPSLAAAGRWIAEQQDLNRKKAI